MTEPVKPADNQLDEAARRQIEEGRQAMRELTAHIPRRFGYADESDLIFRPEHDPEHDPGHEH